MGSVGNQNPWTSYDNYKDCSLGICSIYCPQFCYLMFPPPPQIDDSATPFSPLIIAVIGVLTTAFLLVSYYTIVTRYCKRRTVQTIAEEELNPDAGDNNNQRNAPPAGLNEVSIRNITVCKYQKGDGLIEGSECAVCLSEFQENENFRLLPKCEHAFHLPCIDTWLKSHSNCPLCRTSVVSLSPHPSRSQVLATVTNVNAYRFQRPNDLILVVDDQERNCDVVLSLFDENNDERDHKDDENEARRRSVSLCTFPSRRQLLISDIVKIDKDLQMENDESWKEVGSSQVLFRG